MPLLVSSNLAVHFAAAAAAAAAPLLEHYADPLINQQAPVDAVAALMFAGLLVELKLGAVLEGEARVGLAFPLVLLLVAFAVAQAVDVAHAVGLFRDL